MNRVILLIAFSISTIVANGQSATKKNSAGKTLWVKSCSTVTANFQECELCEDENKTVNCKKYWCSGSVCEPAPKSAIPPSDTRPAPNTEITENQFGPSDTTSRLPEGTYFNNGKVLLKKGYMIKKISGNNIIYVMHIRSGSIQGAYQCCCESGSSSACFVSNNGQALICGGGCDSGKGCKLLTSSKPESDDITTIKPGDKPSPKNGWKIVVIPADFK